MSKLLCTTLGLLLTATGALAQDAQPAPSDYRLLAREVNTLLHRENGSRLEMDIDQTSGLSVLRKETNRVVFNSSSTEHRLVSITVEPIGEETEDTAILTAALLCSLSAVGSIEEGVYMVGRVKTENEKDGLPRSITLGKGIRLMRFKTGLPVPKYTITL